jgi:hypothetical protein
MNSSFLRADGTLAPQRHAWWSDWLPSLTQVQQAIQLRFDATPASAAGLDNERARVLAISMRQGLGLVVIAALLAGFIPFLVNSVTAISLGTPLPLTTLAQQSQNYNGAVTSQLGQGLQTVSGLAPSFFPRWLAALLSTLGAWINWPLHWLTWWLVYGVVTLLVAKIWGAPPTLQRFLAATSYAAAPLILVGLGPIPCLGVVAQVVGVAWMLVVYAAGVRAITRLDWGHTIISILLPAAVVSLIAFAFTVASIATIIRLLAPG